MKIPRCLWKKIQVHKENYMSKQRFWYISRQKNPHSNCTVKNVHNKKCKSRKKLPFCKLLGQKIFLLPTGLSFQILTFFQTFPISLATKINKKILCWLQHKFAIQSKLCQRYGQKYHTLKPGINIHIPTYYMKWIIYVHECFI